MAIKKQETAGYRIVADSAGSSYRFFCDLSGMAVCTTTPINGRTQEDALQTAWETEGKQHFNRCTCCGKWVSDPMYNADTLQCVDCSPWEDKPNYCSHCGKRILTSARFCSSCGSKLRYREVEE